jgi:hypothetical protein
VLARRQGLRLIRATRWEGDWWGGPAADPGPFLARLADNLVRDAKRAGRVNAIRPRAALLSLGSEMQAATGYGNPLAFWFTLRS